MKFGRTIGFVLMALVGFTAHAAAEGLKVEGLTGGLETVPSTAPEVKLTFAPVVKGTAPSVVNVYATRMVQQRRSPFAGDPFFERFFGGRGRGQSKPRTNNSLGSGVIVDSTGIVVTNFHVIRDATEVKVALSDRREFEAEIILRDQKSDLAVLKLKGEGEVFSALSFASQDDLEVGDLVLAIGNPFGVGQTVTQGIVSALARTQVGISDSSFFIQTDAAINPGNSGGALVDVNGDIVGINTAIFSKSGGSIGIGFAIPSDMVRTVVNSALRGSARVERPWIGAQFQDVDADSALALGLNRPSGVLVTSIYEDSPADQARIRVGDLIVAVNDVSFDDTNSFNYRLATLGVGEQAELAIMRDGKREEFEVKLIVAPETVPRDERSLEGRQPFSGATVANLSPALAEELRFKGEPAGVIVTKVKRGSFARRFGLKRGDVILRLNGDTVKNTKELERMAGKSRKTWQFSLRRNGRVLESEEIRG